MKRKVLLINPKFQLSFIAWMSGIAVVVLMVFYAANLYFIRSYLNEGKRMGLPLGHPFFTFLNNQYSMMNWIFLVVAIAVFFFIFITGLYLSHRVAGPIYRVEKTLKELVQVGSQSDIHLKFRSGDYFKELESALNAYIQANRKK